MDAKEAKHRQRQFSDAQREKCWARADYIPGRSPSRWRLDAVGNPVLKRLNGCFGAFCYEFDHVLPYAHGAKTCTKNCQILQTTVNRYKRDLVMSRDQLKPASVDIHCSDLEMDIVERAVYGDVSKAALSKEAGV